MLDSNVLPMTEEVVSKSEMSKPADTPSETEKRISKLLQERVFQRSTNIPSRSIRSTVTICWR